MHERCNIMKSSPSLIDYPPSEAAIAKHLESLVYSMEDTVNSRKFYLSTDPVVPKKGGPPPIWDHCSPFFQAKFEYAANCTLDLEETLQLYREVAEGYPGLRWRVLDVTTNVDEEKGWATCFANVEVVGCFLGARDGLVRQIVGVFEWRLVKKHWRWTSYKAMGGLRGVQQSSEGS